MSDVEELPAKSPERSKIAEELARLQHDNDMLTRGGIIEVAVRNPSVAEYMQHWEGRAEAAETALEQMKGELAAAEGNMTSLLEIIDLWKGNAEAAEARIAELESNLASAVAVEREACARVAETHPLEASFSYGIPGGGIFQRATVACDFKDVAAAIRSRSEGGK